MSAGGYTVEVTGLSPKATEKDLHDFFSFSGAIEHVEIVRYANFSFNQSISSLHWLIWENSVETDLVNLPVLDT